MNETASLVFLSGFREQNTRKAARKLGFDSFSLNTFSFPAAS